jgi:hypothetical protein
MPVPVSAASSAGSLFWLVGLAAVAFLVTWVATEILHLRRTSYVAVLTVITLGMTVGYVAWLGLGADDLVTANWGWGLVAGPVAGAFLSFGITKLPGGHRPAGTQLAAAAVWEGVVYGTSEGLLLSALPVLMTWQLIHSLGWTGFAGAMARWTLPVVASVVVIVVHHLGYWNFRNRILVPVAVGCGLMSVAYLVTASPIAPVVAHVLSHWASLAHGSELPPQPHTKETEAAPIPSMSDLFVSAGR